MHNIVTYVEETMERFAQKAFSSVDSLALSQFVYIHLPAFTPRLGDRQTVRLGDLLRAECFQQMFHDVRDPGNNRRLLLALAASPRFRDIGVTCYSEQLDIDQEKQFAAVTLHLDRETAYVAYRGTDATLVGWKEDFNMAFKNPVPAQEEAVRYLRAAADQWPGELLAGGHSKGGNLAVYASMMCGDEIQSRIRRVYSHDGPGFRGEVLQGDQFGQIAGRIQKTLPQASIVGMLLEHQEPYAIVKSNRLGLMQHDPFSWIVEDGRFHVLEQLSLGAHYVDRTLNEWVGKLSDSERELFIDTLYTVLNAADATTLSQFGAEWQKNIPAALAAARNMDPQSKEFVLRTLRALASQGLKNLAIHRK